VKGAKREIAAEKQRKRKSDMHSLFIAYPVIQTDILVLGQA